MSMPPELKSADPSRYFEHGFKDYTPANAEGIIDNNTKKLNAAFLSEVRGVITSLSKELDDNLSGSEEESYFSVYIGLGGIAYLNMQLAEKLQNTQLTQKALSQIQSTLPSLRSRRISFLEGDPGPLALGAVLYHRLNKQEQAKQLIERLHNMHESVVSSRMDSDELLYGRVGYLHALLFVQKHVGQDAVNQEIIKKVVDAVLTSGQALSRKEKSKSPLKYRWHDSNYIGAAHGISGILYMLLQARKYLSEDQLNGLVLPSLHRLLEIRFKSGNWPSSGGSSGGDKLIHWCHGAPGVVYTYILAYEIFNKPEFYQAAIDAGEVVWWRGILQKGYSLCHGVAGNGYTFLALYQLTKDVKYLYRAGKYAQWCFTYGERRTCEPDRPLSLFEGLAGAIYFLSDILDPDNAKFPAYTL